MKTCFVFEKYRPNEKKKYHQQECYISNFTIVSASLIQIGSLVTEIQNLENIYVSFYTSIYCEKYEQYQ